MGTWTQKVTTVYIKSQSILADRLDSERFRP